MTKEIKSRVVHTETKKPAASGKRLQSSGNRKSVDGKKKEG
jgi:hypothetical protein